MVFDANDDWQDVVSNMLSDGHQGHRIVEEIGHYFNTPDDEIWDEIVEVSIDGMVVQ